MVADYCGTKHTHIELSNDEFLAAIKDVVWATETWDITTIRASTGQLLVNRYIAKNTNIKVVFNGDGSDEVCSGYMYFHKAPSPEEAHKENARLVKNLHTADVLRSDRGTARNGLEARSPFLKYTFIDTYLSIDPRLRVPIDGMEKWLLRNAFKGYDYLPDEVLFRKKEAFSDGVSSVKKSWYQIIQEQVDKMYADEEYESKKNDFKVCVPPNKEALYFVDLFIEMFGKDVMHVIPGYWLPKWNGNVTEPSARVLEDYK